MNTGSRKFVTKEQTSFTELLEQQEAIILDLENLHYYTLNAAASFLWQQLRPGAAVEGLSAALSAAFQINAEQAELDTRAFIDELTRHGLISSTALEAGEKARGSEVTVTERLAAYQPPQLKVSSSLSHVTLSGSSTITMG